MNIADIAQKNADFLAEIKSTTEELPAKKILVEAPWNIPVGWHAMGVACFILKQAKGYVPFFTYLNKKRNNTAHLEITRSYAPEAQYIELAKLSYIEKIKIIYTCITNFCRMFITKDVLYFDFDGIHYGDMLYDTCLRRESTATLHKINSSVYLVMRSIVKRHMQYKKTIQKENIEAVLTTHLGIGINSGCLTRVALSLNIPAYVGGSALAQGKKDLGWYIGTPSKEEIENILSLPEEVFLEKFETTKQKHFSGFMNMDGANAFSDKNIFFTNKKDFCQAYNLNENKKNIFVMAHVFTDYPHSHFEKMLFKDYYDWFVQTVEYARTDTSVNWIFKEHPSTKNYPTTDVDYEKIFKDAPSNIIFLDAQKNLDTRSLEHTADAVITCIGSAGFEMPALYKIPSIIAGGCHYMGYGFTKEPQTIKEYFTTLGNLHSIEKLSDAEQKKAQAIYLFVYHCCKRKVNFVPQNCDNTLSRDPSLYYTEIFKFYEENREALQEEFKQRIAAVKDKNFRVIRTDIRE